MSLCDLRWLSCQWNLIPVTLQPKWINILTILAMMKSHGCIWACEKSHTRSNWIPGFLRIYFSLISQFLASGWFEKWLCAEVYFQVVSRENCPGRPGNNSLWREPLQRPEYIRPANWPVCRFVTLLRTYVTYVLWCQSWLVREFSGRPSKSNKP